MSEDRGAGAEQDRKGPEEGSRFSHNVETMPSSQ